MKIFNDEKQKIERPGREIKVDNSLIDNQNVTVRIGTTDNKNIPQTVYILITFWVDIKNRSLKKNMYNFDECMSRIYSKEIKKIKTHFLKEHLENNSFFPFYYDNIFTYDFPENINYNNKKSFTTIELTLHTCNSTKTSEVYSLKKDSDLFNELVTIANRICTTDLLKSKLDFKIFKSKN